MSSAPSISVLIPTFNRSAWLERTLISVFGQTIPVSEVLVVDDGSTDDTAVVIRALMEEHVEWRGLLHYMHQANQGKSAALNRALGHATGDWIAYDDSDDVWAPQKIEWQLRALTAFPDCGACFTDARFVNNPAMQMTAFQRAKKSYLDPLGRIADPLALVMHPPHGIFMQTVLVRRDVMELAGEFDTRLPVAEDTDFIFRLARHTPFCYVSLPLVEIDRTPDRSVGLTSGRRNLRQLEAAELMLEKWLRILSHESEARTDMRDDVGSLLQALRNELSNWHLLDGARPKARTAMARALHARVSAKLIAKLLMLYVTPGLVARTVRRNAERAK
jgi:glycosyltransferase involved in cell wall biosynthesis